MIPNGNNRFPVHIARDSNLRLAASVAENINTLLRSLILPFSIEVGETGELVIHSRMPGAIARFYYIPHCKSKHLCHFQFLPFYIFEKMAGKKTVLTSGAIGCRRVSARRKYDDTIRWRMANHMETTAQMVVSPTEGVSPAGIQYDDVQLVPRLVQSVQQGLH